MTPLETEANPNIRVGPLRWGRLLASQPGLEFNPRAMYIIGNILKDGELCALLDHP